MYAAAVIKAHHASIHRRVVLVDSFQGLPRASTKQDSDFWSTMEVLQVPQEEVQSKFQQLGLLVDGNVVFVKGFFNESCPSLRRSMMTRVGKAYYTYQDFICYINV